MVCHTQAEDGAPEEDDRLAKITLEQAESMEKKKSKKDKNKAAFGWDVFNQDSLYKAHKKRVANVRAMFSPTRVICLAENCRTQANALQELKWAKFLLWRCSILVSL
jgi:hypothetical protein